MNPLSIVSVVISFFGSPVGKWVGYGLIAVAVYGAGDIRGRRVEHAKCEAAARAAQEAANKQDAQAREDARKNDQDTIASLQDLKGKSDAELAKLKLQLSALPTDAPCLYGVDEQPANRVQRAPPGSGARDKGHPRPALVPSTKRSPAGG